MMIPASRAYLADTDLQISKDLGLPSNADEFGANNVLRIAYIEDRANADRFRNIAWITEAMWTGLPAAFKSLLA